MPAEVGDLVKLLHEASYFDGRINNLYSHSQRLFIITRIVKLIFSDAEHVRYYLALPVTLREVGFVYAHSLEKIND